MLIDWFTVVAQLVNFLILVWLMKRFLYRPILAAIAGREQRIAAQLADAVQRQAEANQLGADLAAKTADFDQHSLALLAQAAADAQAERLRLLDKGRADDAALQQGNLDALRAEQVRLCQAVTVQASQEVLALTRRVLSELADDSMQAGMVRLLLRRLAALNTAARTQLALALAAAPASAVVHSALALDEDQQTVLTQALRDAGLGVGALRFELAAGLLCGIEFSVDGWSLAWNIDGYLKGLEQCVSVLLQAADMTAPPPISQPIAVTAPPVVVA